MIGTTFKLGFDGTSVSRGLGNLTRGIGRGLGTIGKGALLSTGHRLTGLLGSIAMAIPDAVKQTSDWAGSLVDMSNATGASISDLVVLEEKFKLAGVAAAESGLVVSRFAKNIKEAASGDNEAATKALRAIGFDGQFAVGKTLMESFDKVMGAISTMDPAVHNLESIMSGLFGTKLGYQMLKLFRDTEAVTKQAENNVRGLADIAGGGKMAENLDKWKEGADRWENLKRSLVMIGMDELWKSNILGGVNGPNAFFDSIDPQRIRTKIQEISRLLQNTFTYFRESGGISGMVGDFAKDIGRNIAEGLKESFSGGFGLKDLLFPSKKTGGPTAQNDITPELKKHTTLLMQIRDESNTARFA